MLQTKETIRKWLKSRNIEGYTINDDLTVDVDGDVSLTNYHLIRLPIQFGTINGNFLINKCSLKTLKGCPHKIKYKFDCSDNELISLEFCPKEVGSSFVCNNNQIEILNHTPEIVDGDMNFNNNPIKSLEGFNTKIYGYFVHTCSEQKLCIPNLEAFYSCYQNWNQYILEIPSKELMSILFKQKLEEELLYNEIPQNEIKAKRVKI